MITSGLTNFMKIVSWNFLFHFKDVFDNFFNSPNSTRPLVGQRSFATLQIELGRVVDYDSKWSTKFHENFLLDFLSFHF